LFKPVVSISRAMIEGMATIIPLRKQAEPPFRRLCKN
jgi:hypothetical protein